MIKIILATHGHLAQEMLRVLEKIMGPQEGIQTIGLEADDQTDLFHKQMKEAVEKPLSEKGTLILTDIFGGTPTNIALSFLGKEKIEIISGVNIPLLMKIIHFRKQVLSLKELALKIKDMGDHFVYTASQILNLHSPQIKCISN